MATGQLPFRGDSSATIFDSILNRAPVSLVRLNPDLPPKLEEIINKCLEKDRNLRYQHASDIRTDLQRLRRDTEGGKTAASAEAVPPRRRLWLLRSLPAIAVLAAAGFVAWHYLRPKTSGAAAIRSLAVLPLANLSGDPQQEYFADGMTDALIASLAQIKGVKVISRTSTMHYKNSNETMPQIASELGVDAILEASVLRRENSEQAKAERRALNKRLATALIDNWSSAELAARADAELDKALAGELDTYVLDIRAAKYAAPVETVRPHGGGNFWSANAIAASLNAAHAEQCRIKSQFESGRIQVRGASSHGVGASTYSLERKEN